MKDHVKLLNETVEYYKANPRSMDEHDSCRYISPEGARCAIGRILPKAVCRDLESEKVINLHGFLGVNIASLEHASGRDYLTKASNVRIGKLMKDYHGSFLAELQGLHDEDFHWEKTEDGQELSGEGKSVFDRLMLDAEHYDGEQK